MSWKLMIKMAVLFGLAAAIVADDGAWSADQPGDPNTDEKSLVAANNAFGFNCFREILKGYPAKNIFISPSSIAMALAMAYNGAEGTTREAMQKTLELNGLSIDHINQANRSLIEELMSLDSAVQFTIANSLWYRNEFQVESDFLNATRTYYNAKIAGLDFNDPGAASVINRWVEQSTNGKIKDIVAKIDAQTVLFLINAIYFKGKWTNEFKKGATRDDEFFVTPEQKIPCRMMYQDDRFAYYDDSTMQMIELPYGSEQFSMTVVLPRPGVNVDVLVGKLNPETWQKWTSRMQKAEGEIYLPTFKAEYEITLNDVLAALGMGIAFDSRQADFKGINPEKQLYISEVKHKSFVDVNEEGTEAAAATSIGMALACAPIPGFVMRVDRPFMFAIGDRQTGSVIFVGKIVNPTRD